MTEDKKLYACLNNFKDNNEYNTVFEATDEQLKKCNYCPYFQYEDGIQSCNKFN